MTSAIEIAQNPNRDRDDNLNCKDMTVSYYCKDSQHCINCIRCDFCYHCVGLTGKIGYIMNEPPGSKNIGRALITGGFPKEMIEEVKSM